MTLFVTGGAGFIGSNFIHLWFKNNNEPIVNLDLLSYAGNFSNLEDFSNDPRHIFLKGNIADKGLVSEIFQKYKPRAIVNFAAETHVDKSIENPDNFIQTNINGTFNLLQCALNYFKKSCKGNKENFRFLHISTDEVFGSLELDEKPFDENNKYAPNSPYSASKAASDHLVRSFNVTYQLPTIITHCSNNYGPFQLPEKFIPLIICNALKLKEIPLYGDGLNIRDWLHVSDHCDAIMKLIEQGKMGNTYNIGGNNEKTNKEVVSLICEILDTLRPISANKKVKSYKELIRFVKDRSGHDRRYAINSEKIKNELKWKAKEKFSHGIIKTIKWYLSNKKWIDNLGNNN